MIDKLVAAIAKETNCKLFPPEGQPVVRIGHVMPSDLVEFYSLCGGCELFSSSSCGLTISPPTRLRESNLEIVGEAFPDDISDSWYIVARGDSEEAISVDLMPGRGGRCYDSFWDRHGVRGSCPIVARSFTELVQRLLRQGGGPWYWLQPDFEAMGDAYDPT